MIGFLPYWLVHPLSSAGASFYGGIGGDIGELSIAAAIAATLISTYRKHECHVQGCRRPSFHPHPSHGHPVCKRHLQEAGEDQIIG